MMKSPVYFPEATDEPRAKMGGHDAEIPLLVLEGSGPYRSSPLTLHFSADDDAVRYLTALAAEATALAEQVRARQDAVVPV